MYVSLAHCANCARPMRLTSVSRDPKTLGQRVFSCPSCRLIEIRPPEEERAKAG
jgi:hypothetical protein